MSSTLFENLNIHFTDGWTGITGANGGGKTTLLRLASGEVQPDSGTITGAGIAVYVPQRTDNPPDGFEHLLTSEDYDVHNMRELLHLDRSWVSRWNTLSHGERKRTQIASALLAQPDLIALDEPTNHLDIRAKEILINALRTFYGTGLLVSHDRELMDSLCKQCLFINPPFITMRPGTLSEGLSQERREIDTARRQDNDAKSKVKRLHSEIQHKHEESERSAADSRLNRRAKSTMHDHDAREKRNLARLTGKDAWANKQIKNLDSRASRAISDRSQIQIRKEYETGFWLEGADCSKRNFILSVPAGSIKLGENRILEYPELHISPKDRISITGDNGYGKSTLLRYLLGHINLPEEKICYIPQEISAKETVKIKEALSDLDNAELGVVMTSISRLGTRPGRLLESELPSPGETRKILLARSVYKGPHIIIMDEPTNHLDIVGIECLEEALNEAPCALLLISHDRKFIDKLTTQHWHISADENGNGHLAILNKIP